MHFQNSGQASPDIDATMRAVSLALTCCPLCLQKPVVKPRNRMSRAPAPHAGCLASAGPQRGRIPGNMVALPWPQGYEPDSCHSGMHDLEHNRKI